MESQITYPDLTKNTNGTSGNYQGLAPQSDSEPETQVASAPVAAFIEPPPTNRTLVVESLLCFKCNKNIDLSSDAVTVLGCRHAAHVVCVSSQLARTIASGLFSDDGGSSSFCTRCNDAKGTFFMTTDRLMKIERVFVDRYNTHHSSCSFERARDKNLTAAETEKLAGVSMFTLMPFRAPKYIDISFEVLRDRGRTYEMLIQSEGVNLITLSRAGLVLDDLIELGFSPQRHLMKEFRRLAPCWQLTSLFYLDAETLFGKCRVSSRTVPMWKIGAQELALLGVTAELLMNQSMEKNSMLGMCIRLPHWIKFLQLQQYHATYWQLTEDDFTRDEDRGCFRDFMSATD